MRIALNALLFSPGNMGGVETYFRDLLATLANLDQKNEYVLLLKNGDEVPLLENLVNFRSFFVDFPLIPKSNSLWRLFRKLEHQLGISNPLVRFQEIMLNRQIKQIQADVVHHLFGYMFPPLLNSFRNVLTFWDMQHEFYPEFFPKEELIYRKRVYKTSAVLADHIIVHSKYTLKTLVDRYNISPEKISVIYFGVGPEFTHPVTRKHILDIKVKYRLSDTFLFFPAATYPHKNHLRLLRAFKRISEKFPDVQLVLSGSNMSNEVRVRNLIEELGLSSKVRRLGYIPREDIPVLYSAAAMLIFPTLYEGYGIPVLEAMQMGCPVICSQVCSLPELAGDAALFINPEEVNSIATAIERLLVDQQLADELRKRGYEQITHFSWHTTATKILAIYERLMT